MPSKNELLKELAETRAHMVEVDARWELFQKNYKDICDRNLENIKIAQEALEAEASLRKCCEELEDENISLKDTLRLNALQIAVSSVASQNVTQTARKYYKFLSGEENG